MAKFTDAKGRVWQVVATVGAVERVRRHAEVDLVRLFDPKSQVLQRIAEDPVALVAALWAIVEPQAKALGVTPEQFGESIFGDSIADGAQALLDAMVDFSPHSTERAALRRVLTVATRVAEKQAARATIPSEEEIESRMLADLAATGGISSGSAPGSSDSIPGRSVSGS